MKVGKIVVGFVTGFVVGASLVALFTPWSGDEVRETLRLEKPDVKKRIDRVKKKIESLERELEERGEDAVQEKKED
ncbi:MAG TPA: YtxH domain-containing protein [candidate division WOR-3 bacterium]|uniref:YtxH domain-containing protein n=1 Tax=candidate division WOR-3 bacterium TaxID=2052148 RepID=A0A7V5HQQ4_UNCW3|nr:YtxH domain-containing protein [candidate division WOR-3 bacterium]